MANLKRLTKISFVLVLCLVEISFSWAEVPIPELKARVTDLTNTLSSTEKGLLEQQLKELEVAKGSQLAILIIPGTQPESIEQYALRVVENWQLGRKGIDDGALLLIATNDRKLRIEVGYGLEGAIPDAIAKRVISEIITPYFKTGDFYGGIAAGTHQLIRLIKGESLPEPASGQANEINGFDDILFLMFFILFFAPTLRSLFGRLIGSGIAGGIAGFITWSVTSLLAGSLLAGFAIFLLALLFHVGGRSNFPSGRGGYGGGFGGSWPSGGGGFGGGGGGGGFGGGGASGGW